MTTKSLKIAWISDFPVEWLPELPPQLAGLPRRHPATWQIALLAEFARNPGLHIHVVAFRKQLRQTFTFERNGAVFHVLPAAPWARLGSVFWLDTLLIRRLLRRISPDLVHAWGTEKGAGIIAGRLGYPYVMTIQGLFCWYRELVPLPRYDRFLERLERITLRRARVVTAETNFTVNYLRARYPHLKLFQAEHVPNPAFFEVRRQGQPPPVRFVTVGTLGHRKGSDLLFKALEALTPDLDFQATIITNPAPALVEQTRATVSPELWRRLVFEYHLLPQEVATRLGSQTMMLLPTRADNSPNAAKEAAVCGLPLVASAIGGIPDYVFPDRNGVLFPSGDLSAFTAAIRKAVAHPAMGQGRVEPQALEQARRHLSPALMAENFLRAYTAAQEGAGR